MQPMTGRCVLVRFVLDQLGQVCYDKVRFDVLVPFVPHVPLDNFVQKDRLVRVVQFYGMCAVPVDTTGIDAIVIVCHGTCGNDVLAQACHVIEHFAWDVQNQVGNGGFGTYDANQADIARSEGTYTDWNQIVHFELELLVITLIVGQEANAACVEVHVM